MLQCTAVGTMKAPGQGEVFHPLCELGEDHGGEHSAFVTDLDPWGAVFLRWSASRYHLDALPWCGVGGGAHGHVCALFEGHPGPHDWAVTDPTSEAVAEVVERDLRRRFMGLGKRDNETG